MTHLLVNVPGYHSLKNKPHTFEEMVDKIKVKQPCGIWKVQQIDLLTGEVETEQWLMNNWSDNGANTMIRAVINSTSPSAFTPANIIAVDQSCGYAALTTAIAASSTVTSIAVGPLTGPTIPSGTKLLVGAGTANTMNVTLTAAITGAGTYSVSSTTSPASIIPIGANVRYDYTAISTVDLASLSAPVSYTAPLPNSQITYGNRQVTVTNTGSYLLSTAGSPAATAASYTAAWLTNANPVASITNTVLHVVFDAPLVISSTSAGSITIVEKL